MHHLRTTTGQGLSIRFDPRTGQLFFREDDWFAEPLRSTGVPPKALSVGMLMLSGIVQRKQSPRLRRTSRRAA